MQDCIVNNARPVAQTDMHRTPVNITIYTSVWGAWDVNFLALKCRQSRQYGWASWAVAKSAKLNRLLSRAEVDIIQSRRGHQAELRTYAFEYTACSEQE